MADSNESSKTQKKLDTISRQAAIDVLDTGLWGVEWDKALATAMLKDLPPAEPQIIKCGHCRYWRRKTDTYTQGFCDIWRVSRVRKDFCSEGRRKVDLEETDP